MTAMLCDLWVGDRAEGRGLGTRGSSDARRKFSHPEELLAQKDVDAVLIATPEHSHSPMLKVAVEAGKDAYSEKPMGICWRKSKAVRDAVMQRNRWCRSGRNTAASPTTGGARGGA